MSRYEFFLVSFLFASILSAQVKSFDFTRIPTSEGVVHSILKDNRGFMWFGTQGGLNRYDGYNLKVYNKQTTHGGLSHNQIITIAEDKNDFLWLGTLEGLNKFDRRREEFKLYLNNGKDVDPICNNIYSILNLNDSLLIIGTFGYMYTFNKRSGMFHQIPFYQNYSPVEIHSLLKINSNEILVGSGTGLYVYEIETDSVLMKSEHYNFERLFKKNIYSLALSSQDEILVTCGDGFYRINLKTNSYKYVSLSSILKQKEMSVRTILQDSDSNIWIGSNSGLIKYEAITHTCQLFKNNPEIPNTISSDRINQLYQDTAGSLWIATFGNGVNKINLKRKPFSNLKYSVDSDGFKLNFIMNIYGDEEGNVWISSIDKGFAIYRKKDSKLFYYSPLKDQMQKKNLLLQYFAFPFGEKKFCVFDIGSLMTYEIDANMNIRVIQAIDAKLNFLSMEKDKYNNIWASDYEGILKLNCTNGLLNYTVGDRKAFNVVCNFISDDDSILWIGTNKEGLVRYSKNNNETRYIKPSNYLKQLSNLNTIYYINNSTKGILWIGTYGDGLLKYEIAKNKFTAFNTDNGLPDNTVYGILSDEKGNLWCSTNKGLSNYLVKENKFINYDKYDGLINEEYNRRSCYKDKDGIMYFGGMNGVDYFDPSKIKRNSSIPAVVLTDFKLFNEEYPTKVEYSYLNEINLSYDQNSFSFQFASLDLTDPLANKYLYRMDKVDKDWIEPVKERIANYTRLRPGAYTLRVKGTNSDGFWNEAGLIIRINIAPPFWETWWFRGLSGVVIISVIILYVRRKTNRLEKEKSAQERFSQNLIQSVENERRRIARELHDGLGQSLLIIKNKAYSTSEEMNDEINREEVKSIETLAMSSLTEIREIAYNLHPHQIDRLGLTKAIESILNPLLTANEINFTYHLDDIDNLIPKEYEINIFRVVQESLNNISKHSKAKNASVVIMNKDGVISINIEDDGEGFVLEDAVDKKSLGIASMTERIKILKGELNINSRLGMGTVIEVRINSKLFI